MLHCVFARFAGLCLLLLGLTACPSNEDIQSPPSSHTPSLEPSLEALNAGQLHGILVAAQGFQTFKPCGAETEFWVEDRTPAQELSKRYEALHPMELEPVYLVAKGKLESTDSLEGFARDYEQAFFVEQIEALQPWWDDPRCFKPDFIATGSGPDWALKVLQDGDVFFKSQESDFPYVETLAYRAPEQHGNRWSFSFRYRTPQPETLEGELFQESCQHAGKDYAYRAEIRFRGMSYSGCAEKF